MYDGLRVMVAWWMYSVCPVVLSCCRDNRPLTPGLLLTLLSPYTVVSERFSVCCLYGHAPTFGCACVRGPGPGSRAF